MERTNDDVLDMIYNILSNDEVIRQYVESDTDGLRIKYFTYPETADMSGNWIVLESLLNALPSSYSDATWVTYEYLAHVEVWSKSRQDNLLLATRIRDLLWKELGFKQNDSIDEYDEGIYRDARRYEGVLHRHDIDKLGGNY